jgi:enoyl-CoA hydratase/carnithine racemase
MRLEAEAIFVQSHRTGRVGWIEYARPPVNAFNWEMLAAVQPALERHLADTEVRSIVLASAVDRFFSVGADVGLLAGFDRDDAERWVGLCHSLVRAMRAARKPLIAAISGTAVGGGLEIAMNCDVRFASRTSRFGQPEIAIGFIPPVGATQNYARLMGRAAALRFLYDGRLLSAGDALQLGIISEVCDDPRSAAGEYATQLAEKPAEALAAIRRCVVEGADLPFEEGLAIEREEAVRLVGTADYREGTRAFIEKRPARFT